MSSSGVWKQRSGARCGTAGFPEQMLPYRSALRAASTEGCVYGWRVAGGKKKKKKNGQQLQSENKKGGRGESSPSVAGKTRGALLAAGRAGSGLCVLE